MFDAFVDFVNNSFALIGEAAGNVLGFFQEVFNSIAGSL